MTNRTRWLSIGAAVLAVVVGAGAAVAASGKGTSGSNFLGDVAKKLGISESKLTDAIRDVRIERIDAALARGEITKEQADALKARTRSDKADDEHGLPGLGGPPLGVGRGHGMHGFGRGLGLGHALGAGNVLDAASSYLGVTNRQLLESLGSGKSLSDLAKEKGKSVAGLKAAITKSIRTEVDKAVAAGTLTKAQGDKLYDTLAAGADKLVEGGFGGLELRGNGHGFKFKFRLDDDGPGAGFDRDVPEQRDDQTGLTLTF
jgi:hypothetical protein